MGTEFELKYRAAEQTISAIREEIPGQEVLLQMQTTYYDCVDGSLSARHWTLRRRLENGTSICTLKTPGNGSERQEWEVESDSITEAIPELCKLGCPEALLSFAQTGLTAICGAQFQRIAKTIRFQGSLLELALDRGVLMGGSHKLPLCEIEVELKEGNQADCQTFAEDLARRYRLTPEPISKFGRAIALYRGKSHGNIWRIF